MPIKPENRHHYKGKAWQDIRAAVLKRADNACEFCFVRNAEIVYRDSTGSPWSRSQLLTHYPDREAAWMNRKIRIVLTIAHINQDPSDNRPTNTRALCQRCHNLIDLPYRMINAAATRAGKVGT